MEMYSHYESRDPAGQPENSQQQQSYQIPKVNQRSYQVPKILPPTHQIPNIYRKILYPAIGACEDMKRIIYNYVQLETISFQKWAQLFKDGNYQLMHAGRKDPSRYELVSELFSQAFKYTLFPYTLNVRVGALYFLYSIYQTQHTARNQRIRVLIAEWPMFNSLLIDILSEPDSTEAVYIFKRMRDVDKAFQIIAGDCLTRPEDVYEKKGLLSTVEQERELGPFHAVSGKSLVGILGKEMITNLKETARKYKATKHDCIKSCISEHPDVQSALDLGDLNIADIIIDKSDTQQTQYILPTVS